MHYNKFDFPNQIEYKNYTQFIVRNRCKNATRARKILDPLSINDSSSNGATSTSPRASFSSRQPLIFSVPLCAAKSENGLRFIPRRCASGDSPPLVHHRLRSPPPSFSYGGLY